MLCYYDYPSLTVYAAELKKVCLSLLVIAVSGFSLSNGPLKMVFDSSNHLSSWSASGPTHSINHSYVQYVERKGSLEINVCDGSNVYTFVPDEGRKILTPEVV